MKFLNILILLKTIAYTVVCWVKNSTHLHELKNQQFY